MDITTLTATNITLSPTAPTTGALISGTISYDSATKTLTFDPVEDLWYGLEYTVTISGAKDLFGILLDTYSWTFTTVFGSAETAIDGHIILVVFSGKGPVNISEALIPPSILPEGMVDIGLFVNISTPGDFIGANITITYNEADIPEGADEKTLTLYYWDDEEFLWKEVETIINTETNTLKAYLEHLTIFAPMVEKSRYVEDKKDALAYTITLLVIGIIAVVIVIIIIVVVVAILRKKKSGGGTKRE
jgi:hypothetical protein